MAVGKTLMLGSLGNLQRIIVSTSMVADPTTTPTSPRATHRLTVVSQSIKLTTASPTTKPPGKFRREMVHKAMLMLGSRRNLHLT
jgi:hypothetical protein